eukprot:14425919-Alexandrium_andersonii.AAC.1
MAFLRVCSRSMQVASGIILNSCGVFASENQPFLDAHELQVRPGVLRHRSPAPPDPVVLGLVEVAKGSEPRGAPGS